MKEGPPAAVPTQAVEGAPLIRTDKQRPRKRGSQPCIQLSRRIQAENMAGAKAGRWACLAGQRCSQESCEAGAA